MFEQWDIEETERKLQTDRIRGLSVGEARRRLQVNGKNELEQAGKETFLQLFLKQLANPLIYVLFAAAGISLLLQEYSDAVIIAVVVLFNAVIGMLQEGKAARALEALKRLSGPKTVVIRDGSRMEIPTTELVTGDLVCLETGDQVPGDMRLTESAHLMIEESALTGEVVPTGKDALFLVGKQVEVPLGDRHNMAYLSTMVTAGRGKGIVVATGMKTQLGAIARMIHETKEEDTPLQKKLGELGKSLSILSLGLCLLLFGLSLLQSRDVYSMLLTAISLAVAAVPEGLPAVVTICLALSVTRMVKVHAIIRRLPCVETLGAVNVVCSDKTGTLTQNKMTVTMCFAEGRLFDMTLEKLPKLPLDFLWGMVLCNDAVQKAGGGIGDPTELALLELGERFGVSQEVLLKTMPRIDEKAFDAGRKMMSTCHAGENGYQVCYVKGAPDEILKNCKAYFCNGRIQAFGPEEQKNAAQAQQAMATGALRTLAVAMKRDICRACEEDLIFLGMVGMEDPPRPEAKEAVEIFRRAGVKTVMITGDHVDTAYAVGKYLGIANRKEQCMTGAELEHIAAEELPEVLRRVNVFARVSPLQKVRIVKGYQALGDTVAMTGDGVNDAPSLKLADIGIAMGKTGTDVAKEASDMVLADDNFATIEKAIEEGRGVYENIRKAVIFLLSSNFGELMTMFTAVFLGFGSPLKSCHILWINLITDSLPALALGVDQNDKKALMENLPRKKEESLFSRGGLECTCFYGLLIAAVSLAAYLYLPIQMLLRTHQTVSMPAIAQTLQQEQIFTGAQTYAFTVLGMSQLFHAVGMRDVEKSVFRMKHLENKWMILSCVLGVVLQIAVTSLPFLVKSFGTMALSVSDWGLLTAFAAAPLIAHEVFVLFSAKTICHCQKK